jgi:hypothetical protein
MTIEEFLSIFEPLITGAHVEGFRLALQFPVLELRNEAEDKLIEFHFDCRITSNNGTLNDLVDQFSKYDGDIYETAFFIAINRKSIISIDFSKDNNLKLQFSNDIELTFRLNDEWTEPLNISVMKDGKYLYGCRLLNDGTIEK